MSPTQEDSDKYVQGAIDELDKDKGKFAENVSNVAEWAVQVDESFAKVTYGLTDVNNKYGVDFLPLGTYLNEWKGYNTRWTKHLLLSRDVASEHAVILKRFDQVFIEMIQEVKTEQDRKDVIAELNQFANEDHGQSQAMAQGFRNLKHDIETFVGRFNQWIETTSAQLQDQAKELQKLIQAIQEKIKELDIEIVTATAALLAAAASIETLVSIIGLVVAGITLAVLIVKRVDQAKELTSRQKELAEVNRKQEALAHIKTAFDGLQPDIVLICQKLALFGDIWSSVRTQTLAFQQALESGMDAVTNLRFKKQLELAKKLCGPLRSGLEKYATQLENRK
jgi:DNA repair exonuclease SbcCD ATPase subunit